nr:hypothetical protein [Tanacetum cinerariifolium]
MLQEVKSWLCKCFSMKDLGEAAYILGIKIIRDIYKRLIALSQSAYLEKILKKFWMENSKKGYTLMIEKPDYRKSQGAKTPSEVQHRQRVPYASAIAVLKYLRNTKDMVLMYGAKHEVELKVSCYANASFQTDKDDTKSQIGYVFILNGGALDWKSANQSTIAVSSIEAEYIATAEASMKVIWMRKFIDDLEANVQKPPRKKEKKYSLAVLGAIVKMKSKTKPTKKLVSWLNWKMRKQSLFLTYKAYDGDFDLLDLVDWITPVEVETELLE